MTEGTPGRPRGSTASRPVSHDGVVLVEDFGELIRSKREAEGLTLEQAATQSGVSAATLWRWERQHRVDDRGGTRTLPAVPDTRTLAAVARWLGVALDRIVDVPAPATVHDVHHHEGDSVPEMVAAHLRADRNLDSGTAAALARMFKVAYEQFAKVGAATTASTGPSEPSDERESPAHAAPMPNERTGSDDN